jgi:ethanolamine utilization microcompartment shell protein EutL
LARSSRLLKKSGVFADEGRIIAVVDVEVADEATGGADHGPSATAGGIIFVVTFPGELRTG